ncbi:hypothetical protein [Shewanella sp. UCD-KL21]|uniref:hypothetical protein n=1 Tax=Shewanella sp. UCD-KL21 TaxID=1917164 RepID=UPI000970E71A|nr:hypothetical protein [Shewanella sp. UCD-KL21]
MDELNELSKLLISIFAPLLLVFTIVLLLYLTRHKDRSSWGFWKYFRTFDPSHGLGSQPLFAIAIVYPIGLFFSTGIWTWSGLSLELSADGYKQFIEISKLPLGLLALSIPLAALTARLHGTKQTALQISKAETQINEVKQKNKTDLYLAHYKHFCEYIEQVETKIESNKFPTILQSGAKIKIDTKKCYIKLYEDSSLRNGPGGITTTILNNLTEELILNLAETIKFIKEFPIDDEDNQLYLYESHLRRVNTQIYSILRKMPIQNKLESLFISQYIGDAYDIEGVSTFIANIEQQLALTHFIYFLYLDIYAFDLDSIINEHLEYNFVQLHGLLTALPKFKQKISSRTWQPKKTM